MKLKYRLQALLLLKKQKQEQALLQYARTVQQVNVIYKKYQQLCEKLQACESWIVKDKAFSCQQHVLHLQQLEYLNVSVKSVKQHLEVLKQEEKKRLDHFLETKKEVAILEKIKEKQMIKFRKIFEDNEAKERDDWAQGHYRKII